MKVDESYSNSIMKDSNLNSYSTEFQHDDLSTNIEETKLSGSSEFISDTIIKSTEKTIKQSSQLISESFTNIKDTLNNSSNLITSELVTNRDKSTDSTFDSHSNIIENSVQQSGEKASYSSEEIIENNSTDIYSELTTSTNIKETEEGITNSNIKIDNSILDSSIFQDSDKLNSDYNELKSEDYSQISISSSSNIKEIKLSESSEIAKETNIKTSEEIIDYSSQFIYGSSQHLKDTTKLITTDLTEDKVKSTDFTFDSSSSLS